jgi:hypothetical protein
MIFSGTREAHGGGFNTLKGGGAGAAAGFAATRTGPGLWLSVLVLLLVLALPTRPVGAQGGPPQGLAAKVEILSQLGDRSTGTKGAAAAADFIEQEFERLGFEEVGRQRFGLTILHHESTTLQVGETGTPVALHPLRANAVSPGTVAPPGLEGPLVYVGPGTLADFNGKTIEGAIVLMDMDSGKRWRNAAAYGAKALIYLDRGPTAKSFFDDKFELTPIDFPRFWMTAEEVRAVLGEPGARADGVLSETVRLVSRTAWQETEAENVYCLIPGANQQLQEEIIVVEAFYDSRALVTGLSPGADEALGTATLLELAAALKSNPPERPILLVASAGHDQTLAGMREMIWSLRIRSRELRVMQKDLDTVLDRSRAMTEVLDKFMREGLAGVADHRELQAALDDRIKTDVDLTSQELMRLRLRREPGDDELIRELAARRLLLRQLAWRESLADLSKTESGMLEELAPLAIKGHQRVTAEIKKELRYLKSAQIFRNALSTGEIKTMFSLHLSSQGDGVGAFNQGWLYPIQDSVNRVASYSNLDDTLEQAALKVEADGDWGSLYVDTLRPNRLRTWDSHFIDRPYLGGEVSSLAGFLGVSLVTINDARRYWGTPYDTPGTMDMAFAERQSRMVCGLIQAVAKAPSLEMETPLANGFSTVHGRANFIRHGELFPDQPALGTTIMAFQGSVRYYATVDSLGRFMVKGVADKKHVVHKVILEGYRFDNETGRVIWAIDKGQTGKDAYRVRMQRRTMETDLVMFTCRQTTIFNLLEPRSFRYMTRINLLDARLEASPLRYWWSRIDTRESVLLSLYLEPGTRLKLTLADSVLRKNLILLNASAETPLGIGYLIDDWPTIPNTDYRTARDMWTLLEPRIANLESHGIFNEKIRALQQDGLAALQQSEEDLGQKIYDSSSEAAAKSWALASRVYDSVEKTQKDVLFGVLFYIALFVPFAFCMERLLFSYADINRRILAFLSILLILIVVIYHVHPAFQLAYSPTVVILAFFIMGLSLVVTLIIFFRFEEEMVRLQKRASQVSATEMNRWQAFMAAFFLGVSNLRRRRLRTALTCTTLIILTFTIMSFTSVQSLRHVARILYTKNPAYQGLLLKNANWRNLPPDALETMTNAFSRESLVAPRVWLEGEDRSRPVQIPVRLGPKTYQAQGLLGLTAEEAEVSHLDRILVGGRWFNPEDRQAVLLPQALAEELGLDPKAPSGTVELWNAPYEVVGVFSGRGLQEQVDLDGEPLTPVTFPGEANLQLTEVELEAMESGDDFRTIQSRYQHIAGDLTVIVPARTLLAAGGGFKSLAVKPDVEASLQDKAESLVDRFKLTLFVGEGDGTYLYQASDTLSYSGVPNIVIPILISVFIVLNTMIGSVYERKREIGIYTSVGLAPSHVSFLFIAESLAFAVLSVVLGYLLAQGTSRIFAGTALWAGITVNYSSLAGVAAMLLVFLVVLVSVIYPSRVAAEIAIPDVNRSWTMPEATDNLLEVALPVLVKTREFRGLGGYMLTYFQAHREVSHGLFSTGDIDLLYQCDLIQAGRHIEEACQTGSCEGLTCLHFRSLVWLAPFDFGIMQAVDTEFAPSLSDHGYLEIKVRLERRAGEANAWRRINKAFINQLRKQLLVWRSLNEEAHAEYERVLDKYEEGIATPK